MTSLNFAIPTWLAVSCFFTSSSTPDGSKLTLSDYAEFCSGLSKIFSGCVLIFSIIKIEREIKRRRVPINTANLMCHATAFILFTLVSLLSSIVFYYTQPSEKPEVLVYLIRGFFYVVSQAILLVILWRLGTKEPV